MRQTEDEKVADQPIYITYDPRCRQRFHSVDVGAAVLQTNEMGTIEMIADGEVLLWEAPDQQDRKLRSP